MSNVTVTDYRDSPAMHLVAQLSQHGYVVINRYGNRRGTELSADDCSNTINVVAVENQPDRVIRLLGLRWRVAGRARQHWVATITPPRNQVDAWRVDMYGSGYWAQLGELIVAELPATDTAIDIHLVENGPRDVNAISDPL